MSDKTEKDTEKNLQNENEEQELFDALCEDLKGVIPDEIFDTIKAVRPIEVANLLLWRYGGSIRQSNPEVNLKGSYDYPKEVNQLNDKIGSFSFTVAPTPFVAIAWAVSANQDFNEEIIMSRELEGYVPIVIKKDDGTKHLCLIDYKNQTIQITMEFGLRIDVDMAGNPSEQKKAVDECMEGFKGYLEELKQHMEETPKIFDDPEEKQAVLAWCEKHSYTIQAVFRASIDRYF